MSVEVWGNKQSMVAQVWDLVSVLESVCSDVEGGVVLNPAGNTIMDNASFNTAFPNEDPDTGWPRIVCDVLLTVKASAPSVITAPA